MHFSNFAPQIQERIRANLIFSQHCLSLSLRDDGQSDVESFQFKSRRHPPIIPVVHCCCVSRKGRARMTAAEKAAKEAEKQAEKERKKAER